MKPTNHVYFHHLEPSINFSFPLYIIYSMDFLSLFLIPFLLIEVSGAPEANQPRSFFVFGDSLVDNGNNNFLVTYARADMPPYGIDTPSHRPNGRFSNGRNIPDIISFVFSFLICFYVVMCYFT